MTRAMVAIEILRNEKHSDFKDVGLPSIPEVVIRISPMPLLCYAIVMLCHCYAMPLLC